MAMLKATGVGKRFTLYDPDRPRTIKQLFSPNAFRARPKGEFWAVRGLDLEVAAGEMVGVIGHNGSGKSTLLRLLGGVMRADEGTIDAAGKISGLLELNTGVHPDLSGRENIIINGVVAGLTRREVLERFDEIVAFAELERFIDNPMRTYSSGMKMRLGFAVAAHVRPQILLIDEILSVGDLAFQEKCLARIARFKEDGCAIVLITHDLAQVEDLCDRAIWLRRGEVAGEGSPLDLVDAYRTEMLAETQRRTPADAKVALTKHGVPLKPGDNRLGSQEAVVTDVRLLDANGEEVASIETSDPLVVEFTVTTSQPMTSLFLGVTIGTKIWEDAVDVNTDGDRIELPPFEGQQTVRVFFDRLDLTPENYMVSIGVYEGDWLYAYDYHWEAYPLRVTGMQKPRGVMSPPRRWEVVRGSRA